MDKAQKAYIAAANGDMGALWYYDQGTLLEAMRRTTPNMYSEDPETQREAEKANKVLNNFLKGKTDA
jgi:hypothetical protein